MRLGSIMSQAVLTLKFLHKRGCNTFTVSQIEDLLVFANFLIERKERYPSFNDTEEYEAYKEEAELATQIEKCAKTYKASSRIFNCSAGQIDTTIERLEKHGLVKIKTPMTEIGVNENTELYNAFRKYHPPYKNNIIVICDKIEEFDICKECKRRLECVIGK